MRTLAVANHKGGSGKSTTGVHLAAVLAERGHRVLVVDLDAQGTAAHWLRVPGGALLDVYARGAELDPVPAPMVPGVDVVAAGPGFTERALSAVGPLAVFALRRALLELHTWQWCILDTPPALGVATSSALVAASDVLVTVEGSLIALPGLVAVSAAVRDAQAAVSPGPTLAGVLVCRADLRTVNARAVVDALRADPTFGPLTLETVIRDRVALRDAAGLRLPVTITEPHGQAAADYRALADEMGA